MSDKNIINKKSFGKKIRTGREKLHLTQFELAEKIDVSPNFLGDIERGLKLPSIKTLILLSNALKLSLDSLFSDSLDNILSEPDEVFYTDRQMAIIRKVINDINQNF